MAGFQVGAAEKDFFQVFDAYEYYYYCEKRRIISGVFDARARKASCNKGRERWAQPYTPIIPSNSIGETRVIVKAEVIALAYEFVLLTFGNWNIRQRTPKYRQEYTTKWKSGSPGK